MRKLKRKANGICIFCGTEGEITDEHVFPEAWYPDDTPPDLWRWQAPACYKCNHDHYGMREAKVFPFLAMTAEPHHPGAKGIAERAFRAADQNAGKKPKDKKMRANLRELMAKRMEVVRSSDVPEGADYLGFRHQQDELLSTFVHEHDLLPVIGKIARGIIYLDCGQRVDERFTVRLFRELSKVPPMFLGMTATVTYSCGPGIVVDLVKIKPYPPISFMQIRIWDTHVWYAAVIPKPEYEEQIIAQGEPDEK